MVKDLKELVSYLITILVRKPEEVSIEEEKENDSILEKITVAAEDVPVVIGKGGRNIKAIRDLVRMVASKHQMHVEVKILA